MNGKSQREMELEQKLSEAEAARKKAEFDALEAQGTVQQLKEIDSRRPVPGKKKTKTIQPLPFLPLEEEVEDDESEA